MRSLESWLAEYSVSHRNSINQAIHRVCVPLILWSIVGLCSLLRGPPNSPFLSGASALCLGALVFYYTLGVRPFLEMLVQLIICLLACAWLETKTLHPSWVYAIVFVVGWVGQAVGHGIEGRKPAFFRNLQFLLIGPLWILRKH